MAYVVESIAICIFGLTLSVSIGGQTGVIWSRIKGSRLIGCTYHSIEGSTSIDCGHYCSLDQRCLSINYKTSPAGARSHICELNGRKKDENDKNLLDDPKYTYYEPFGKAPPPSRSPLPSPLPSPPPSTTPSPKPSSTTQLWPQTCTHLLNTGLNLVSGVYQMYTTDSSTHPTHIYCHLDHRAQKAWALVLAFTFDNNGAVAPFSFDVDAPVNDDMPNFDLYRMPRVEMQHIRDHATEWRAICGYHGDIIDDVDTVRSEFSIMDPFQNITGCGQVTYINVRGYWCKNCTVLWYQAPQMLLHVDSQRQGHSCGFNATGGAYPSEDNFGFYVNVNKRFGCTKYPNSTTSWWFG